MKKASKILLITALALGIVGTGMTVGGAAMGADLSDIDLEESAAGRAVSRIMNRDDTDEDSEPDCSGASGADCSVTPVPTASGTDCSVTSTPANVHHEEETHHEETSRHSCEK